MINIKKLTKWNLSQPLEKRYNSYQLVGDMPSRIHLAKYRAGIMCLRATIIQEIEKSREHVNDRWVF